MGENKKQLALSAIQEFCANIFIQPIHGLLLSVIVILPFTGRAVESLILVYSLIPATTLARSLFFGNGGGLIHRTANIMKNSSMAIGAGLAVGAGAGTIHGAGQILNAGFKNVSKNSSSKGSSSNTIKGNPNALESSPPDNYATDTGIKEKINIPEDAVPSTPETKKDYFIKNLKNTASESKIINAVDTTAKKIKNSAIGHTIQNAGDKLDNAKQSLKETPIVQTVGNFMKDTSDKFNDKINNFKETPLAKSINENIPDVLDKTKKVAKNSIKLAAIPASAAGGVILSGIGGGLKTASFGNIGCGVSKAGDMMASYSGKKMSDIALSGKNKWDNLFKEPEKEDSLNNISDTEHKDTNPDYLEPKTSMDISESTAQHTFDKNTFSEAGISNFKVGKNGYVSYNINSKKVSDKDNENLSYYSELYKGNIYSKDSEQYKSAIGKARENGVQYASQEMSNGNPTGIYHLELNKNANKKMGGYYRQSKEERENGLISFIQNKNNTTDYMGAPITIQKPDIVNNKTNFIPEIDNSTPDNKNNNIDNNTPETPTINDKIINRNLMPSPSIPKLEDNTTDVIAKDKTIDNSKFKTKKSLSHKCKNNTIKNKNQNSNNNINIPPEYTDIINETLNNK